MSPYYADDSVTLYHGDCREVTEWLAADVLVTDPPYGISGRVLSTCKPTPGIEKPTWDADLATRDAALALWGDRPYAVFGAIKKHASAPRHRSYPLIWDKGGQAGMGDRFFPWKPSYELIYVFGEGWSGRRNGAVLRHATNVLDQGQIGHPTPKPLGLMEAILLKAPPGTIADPFAGSGSTLVAAKQLGRRAIGVELEERYCEIAARRLAQDTLFGASA